MYEMRLAGLTKRPFRWDTLSPVCSLPVESLFPNRNGSLANGWSCCLVETAIPKQDVLLRFGQRAGALMTPLFNSDSLGDPSLAPMEGIK
jgi:hypothetical protein